MRTDKYGQIILQESDICDLYLADSERQLSKLLTEDTIVFSDILNLEKIPDCIRYIDPESSIENFDLKFQSNWYFPKEYQDFDIAKFVLDQCQTDEELQRAGHELLMFQERNMFMLLKYLKYLVDVMRENNIVWGVGRGSSVASFVLFLIGIHRINSLYYDLPIEEFLK